MNTNYDAKNKEAIDSPDRTVIKTGASTYTFTQSWVENEALRDILVGLIADDYNGIKNN